MCQLGILWAGSLALRRSLFDHTPLLEHLKLAAVDDGVIRRSLDELHLKIRFVPSLMMVNREECGVRFSLDFVTRQDLWTMLYHPNRSFVPLHGIGTVLLLIGTLAAAVAALIQQDFVAAAIAGGAILIYQISMLGLLAWIERTVR